MNLVDFYKHLEKEAPKPLYLFKGEAEFLMEEAWKRLVQKIVPSGSGRFNAERLIAKEHLPDRVLERVSTLPMFGGKRVIMVQNIEGWSRDQRKTLQAYLTHPHPTSCLVLTTLQKKSELEQPIATVGAVVEFTSPTEREAPRWIQERAGRYGKLLTGQAVALLIGQTGMNLYLLDRELEKLSLYVGDRKKIEEEDVRQVVGSQRSFSVFELLNHIGEREEGRAVTALRKLLLAGEAPLGILALLARHIRILWQVKDGQEQGMPLGQMGRTIGLPPSIVKKYIQQASFFSQRELQQSHEALRAADLTLKSTGISPVLILEDLIFALCRNTQKSP